MRVNAELTLKVVSSQFVAGGTVLGSRMNAVKTDVRLYAGYVVNCTFDGWHEEILVQTFVSYRRLSLLRPL